MYADRTLAAAIRARTARDHGVDILLDAWSGSPPDRRAAMAAAQGDLARAASYAGEVWRKLLDGDVKAVLNDVSEADTSPGLAFARAEGLFAAGAVVAGLERLEVLHSRGDPVGTLALARRRHQLGDDAGAVEAAKALPWHAHAALTGARAALSQGRPGVAFRFVEPYLQGHAPLPEPAVAAAFAMTTAATLARLGEYRELRRFVDRLLPAGDLAEDMMPAVARAAWFGGRAREAWQRFDVADHPWCVAARLELAVLAGDAGLAAKLLSRAGPLGVPSRAAVNLLQGAPDTSGHAGADRRLTEDARRVFAEGKTVHVWRTHRHRWAPWIEAALQTPADVLVCDLAAQVLPAPDSVPWAVLDDGALVEVLAPVPVGMAPPTGQGVGVGTNLCRGVGVGFDWPDDEDAEVRGSLPAAAGAAAVEIVNAEDALAKSRPAGGSSWSRRPAIRSGRVLGQSASGRRCGSFGQIRRAAGRVRRSGSSRPGSRCTGRAWQRRAEAMAFKDPHGAHRRAGIPLVGVTWRDQEIAGDDIAGMVLKDCTLERVRLTGTSLWQTMFVDSRLDDCEFVDCRVFRTQWVNCRGAGFRIAGGEFAEAVVSECDFDQLSFGRSGDRNVLNSCRLASLAFLEEGCVQHGLTISGCTLTAVDAEDARWVSATAVGVDFAAWSMRGAVFDRCVFVESKARGLDLSDVRFDACNLYKGDFRGARIRRAPGSIFAESDCTEADFVEAELTGALFANVEAPDARFDRARLGNAMFPGSMLVGADFSGAFAVQSVWNGADLTDAGFERVDAYRSAFRNGVLTGARVDGARFVEADLHGVEASLDGADVTGAQATVDWRAEREKEARPA